MKYTVNSSDDSGAGSLREAIALANENPGLDTIVIETDKIELSSEIQISDSVEIEGNDVVITQTEDEGIFYIDDFVYEDFLDVSIANLTLTGGNRNFGGGALLVLENLALDNVTVRDNKGVGYGAGLYAYGSNVTITNSLFEGNVVLEYEDGSRSGSAVFVENGSLEIDNSIFRKNDALQQTVGVVYGLLEISNSEIIDNVGSGLGTRDSSANISNILVDNNSGTGMYAIEGSIWTIEDSTISNHQVVDYAGGLGFINSVATITNSLIDDNSASPQGGGIFLGPSAEVEINNSIVSNNSASQGSAMFGYDDSTKATITDTYFSNNTGGEQIEGFNLTYQGSNVDNPYGVEPAESIGYTAPTAEETDPEEPDPQQPTSEEPKPEEPAPQQPTSEEPNPEESLNINSTEVHRFYQYEKGFHFYTADNIESNVIQQESAAGNLSYEYEGESYRALTRNTDTVTGEVIEGAEEVYRFFNSDTGGHLFTMFEAEKEYIDTLDNYSYEGVAYYAFESQHESIDTIPVYRMLNEDTGTHLFTADSNEVNYIQDNLSNFSLEGYNGVAFYVMEI